MKKVLVANRGEIAIRVLKTLKKLGIVSVAVYSDADKQALHLQYADEIAFIGYSSPALSYLNIEKIVETALAHEVDAIHPGYGFLSENAEFAKAVENAGLVFIGPKADTMTLMGSKLMAKQFVENLKIPTIGGSEESIKDIAKAKVLANKLGFPILIKASAGGGGKGMKQVDTIEDFEVQVIRAMSETQNSFGSDEVFIEKLISSPKHIEIQILADKYGNCVHLYERECSIQRRHQKVIEEAPSAILPSEVRERMGQAAIKIARESGYLGVGTIEFLVDCDFNFYFLEMNTRLQVEHPVTEWIFDLDLVALQILVADNKPLPFRQDQLIPNGNALELRIYAEDPEKDFIPSPGILKEFSFVNSPNVRLDTGYQAGQEIPIFYDPMIAKLIVWGKNRDEAIAHMLQAIQTFQIEGVPSTLPFGNFVLQHRSFKDGSYNTHFINQHYIPQKEKHKKEKARDAALLAIACWFTQSQKLIEPETHSSPWKLR